MENPMKMKAVVRTKDGKNSPYLAEIPIPTPTPNSVIIKVLASPINPSDEHFSTGSAFREVPYEPYVCGFEGAGVITAVGDNVPKEVIGKKVVSWPAVTRSENSIAFWCEYARVPLKSCIFLEDSEDCGEYCSLFVNPLSILAFLRIIGEMKAKTIILTAAMSSLCKSMIKICKKEGIDVVAIIRKEEDLKKLIDMGAKYALNLQNPDFEKQLKEIAAKEDIHLAFDAIKGDMPNKLLLALPKNSILYVYGTLSYKQLDITEIKDLMDKEGKELRNFLVFIDRVMTDPEELKKAMDYISKNRAEFFKISVAHKYGLSDFKLAMDTYKTMVSSGKVIFAPNS